MRLEQDARIGEKRIRNNPAVQIAPSTRMGRPLGQTANATARMLSATEQVEAQSLTAREFGWLKKVFGLIWRLQGREQVYLEITPTEERRRVARACAWATRRKSEVQAAKGGR